MDSSTHNSPEISKDDWKGHDKPSPEEIVGGKLYPACVACFEANMECTWIFGVIEKRMQHAPGEGGGRGVCEGCSVRGSGCDFVWEFIHSLRKIDDALERLVQHARSENRKAGRRISDNNVGREFLGKALSNFK